MKMFNHRNRQKFVMGAIALAFTTTVLPACGPRAEVEEPVSEGTGISPEETVEEPNEIREELNVQVGDLTGNAEDYIGQTVSVRGEAEVGGGENAFILQDDQLFGGSEVIVFNATGMPFLLPSEELAEEVQVTGEVRQFVIADLEQEYGLTLDPEIYAEYEEQPVIIAESIALAPDPEAVSENPEAFYNQVIAVSGQVEERVAPNAFTIEGEGLFEGEQVLVVGVTPNPVLEDDEEVVVTGVLRPYVSADFERDYDLQWDLDVQEQIEAEYTEEPVLVAQEVYPSAQ